jgi:hypothetical protein
MVQPQKKIIYNQLHFMAFSKDFTVIINFCISVIIIFNVFNQFNEYIVHSFISIAIIFELIDYQSVSNGFIYFYFSIFRKLIASWFVNISKDCD